MQTAGKSWEDKTYPILPDTTTTTDKVTKVVQCKKMRVK